MANVWLAVRYEAFPGSVLIERFSSVFELDDQ
jgi:hypothetical protein